MEEESTFLPRENIFSSAPSGPAPSRAVLKAWTPCLQGVGSPTAQGTLTIMGLNYFAADRACSWAGIGLPPAFEWAVNDAGIHFDLRTASAGGSIRLRALGPTVPPPLQLGSDLSDRLPFGRAAEVERHPPWTAADLACGSLCEAIPMLVSPVGDSTVVVGGFVRCSGGLRTAVAVSGIQKIPRKSPRLSKRGNKGVWELAVECKAALMDGDAMFRRGLEGKAVDDFDAGPTRRRAPYLGVSIKGVFGTPAPDPLQVVESYADLSPCSVSPVGCHRSTTTRHRALVGTYPALRQSASATDSPPPSRVPWESNNVEWVLASLGVRVVFL